MMDSLEKIIARFSAKLAVKIAPILVKYLYLMETPGVREQFGPGAAEREKPALFVIKHQHMLEYVAGLYPWRRVAKKQPVIPVKEDLFRTVNEHVFRSEFAAAFLTAVRAIPTNRRKDEGHDPYSRERKTRHAEMVRNFEAGGWYAYCPEETRKWGRVGLIEPYNLAPVRIAARHGVDVYILGIEYKRILPVSPWIPFLTKIVVRFEKYDPSGKNIKQLTQEIRETMAKLSGLEGKLEEPPHAAVSGAQTKSAAGYN